MGLTRWGAGTTLLLSACGAPLREPADLYGVWVIEGEDGEPVGARVLGAGDEGSNSTAVEEYHYDELGARLVRTGQWGLDHEGGKADGVRYRAQIRFVYDGADPYGSDVLALTQWERIVAYDGDVLEVVTPWSDDVFAYHRTASVP